MTNSTFSRRSLLRRGAILAIGGATLGRSRSAWAEDAPSGYGDVPGVVVDHSPASSRIFVGSPSIAILPDGDYVASHDWFGPKAPDNTTVVFRSSDRGQQWRKMAELKPQFWSSLFVHEGKLYLVGTSRGSVGIRRSMDGGASWTSPDDAQSGLLLGDGKYHCAPVPVIVHQGRLWRAMEDVRGPGGRWGRCFRAFMLSAPVDADLLRADAWQASNRLGSEPRWLDGKMGGWLEGNAVVTPEGQIVNMLRVDYRVGGQEMAAVIRVSPDGKECTFDPATGFVEFPGGCKKFSIRRDPQSGLYWTLANYVPQRHWTYNPERARNTSVLMASRDLRTWEARCAVLYGPDIDHHGFQYLDWQFDGDDLVVASRTAYDDGHGGADNQHNANFLTFHRLAGFRSLSPEDSVAPWLAEDLKTYNARLSQGKTPSSTGG